jgi:O-antigen/teichoic acid export membrane protein
MSLVVSILLARLLGPEGYGVYAFAYAVIMLLALPAHAGLPTLLVREVARYEAEERWGLLAGLLRRSNQLVALLTLLIVAGALAVMLLFDLGLSVSNRATFAWALVLLPILALGFLRGAALRGLRRVVQGQLPEVGIRPGLFVLALVGVLAASSLWPGASIELTPQLAMALHAGAALIAFIVGVWLLRRELPEAVARAKRAYETQAWLRSLLPLTLLASVAMINSRMDIVLLGVLTTPADVGVYRVAYSMATPVTLALSAVNLAVAPYFARAYSGADQAGLQRLATWSARVSAVVALPAAIVLIAVGGPILGFVFGSEFAAGAGALALLVVGQLGNVAAGSVGNILNMSGHETDTVVASGLAALVNLALNLVLIPPFGIGGAATATMTSLVLWNAILVHRVWRRTGVISVAWWPGRSTGE